MPMQSFAFDLLHCFWGKCQCSILLLVYFIVSGVNASAVFTLDLHHYFRGKCKCGILLLNYYVVSGANASAIFCS